MPGSRITPLSLSSFLCAALLVTPFAFAQSLAETATADHDDLISVFEAALAADPQLQIERHQILAERAAGENKRAATRPSVATNSSALTGGSLGVNAVYSTIESAVRVNIPVFDPSAWARSRAGKATVEASHHFWSYTQQQFVLRVSSAYLDTLRASDQLLAAEARAGSAQKQLQQVRSRERAGLATRNDLEDALAGRDTAKAASIATKTQLTSARLSLEILIGREARTLKRLRNDYPLTAEPVSSQDTDDMIAEALQVHPNLLATRKRYRAAKSDLEAAQGARLPKVNIGASLSAKKNDLPRGVPPGSLGIDGELANITATLEWPIYTGGAIQSSVDQASAAERVAHFQVVAMERRVSTEIHVLVERIAGQAEEAKARDQAVKSAQLALDAAQVGFEFGTRNAVDLVRAAENYYNALSAWHSARYDLVTARLALAAARGALGPQQLTDINEWLESPSPS